MKLVEPLPKLVGLMTTYREGELVRSAIASLAPHVDRVFVLEGAAGAPSDGPESVFETRPGVAVVRGDAKDDAAKRSRVVELAKAWHKNVGRGAPLWGVWLDGDEVLLWGEYLRDWIRGAIEQGAEQNATGGFGLRHVEALDGSVGMSTGRVLDLSNVERYLVSGYQVELTSGMVVALPLVPLCGPGGVPLGHRPGMTVAEAADVLARERPPVAGEPHTLHRSSLRSRSREASRQHQREGDWFSQALAEQGLQGV